MDGSIFYPSITKSQRLAPLAFFCFKPGSSACSDIPAAQGQFAIAQYLFDPARLDQKTTFEQLRREATFRD
ncbi:MAG: hypothetical protein IPO41_13195 [Acidobacteria bacterium]|nr:hypothetical protein [Acidobacteriota bacterium]MBP9110834.1 hypothetical protein [Pyrinomonadaceae bacterium]